MFYAMKNNKQVKITEDEKQKFINQGYKIAKLNDGKLEFEEIETEESKKISKLEADYKKLKVEHEKLLKELESLKEPKQGMSKEDAEAKELEKIKKVKEDKEEGK